MDGAMQGSFVDQALLKRLQRLVGSRLLQKNLRRAAPDHHLPVGLRLELGNVIPNLVRQVALVLARLLLLPSAVFT